MELEDDAVSANYASLRGVINLLGTRAVTLNPPRSGKDSAGLGGTDVDLAVQDLDPLWPLRVTEGWRLVQCLHYDVTGWYWIIEKHGAVVALDTIDDPHGLGRYGFAAVPELFTDADLPPPDLRAAYLTIKRLRKGARSEEDWGAIATLARADEDRYVTMLRSVVGRQNAAQLGAAILDGNPPPESLTSRARRAQTLRRFRSPSRAIRIATRHLGRVVRRVTNPTGFVILLVGPDGTGKSTVAEALPEACAGMFRRVSSMHWRPGLFPQPGRITGTAPADASRPHGRPPHGRFISLALLGYYWADFVIGGALKIQSPRARSGLVVVERGWWDMAVDPGRYRLDVSPALIRRLGALVPKPDLLVLLDVPPTVAHARKREISLAEIERQLKAWRDFLPRGTRRVAVDASTSPETVVGVIRDEMTHHLHRRAMKRLGAGWAGLPRNTSPRWLLPRGPKVVATQATSLYQPVTTRGLLGWWTARVASRAGAFRLLPRADAPEDRVVEALRPYLAPGSTISVSRANHPERYLALVLGRDGDQQAFLKLAFDHQGREALANEARSLEHLARQLPAPLSAPGVLDVGEGLLGLVPVRWTPRWRPGRLPLGVAHAMGAFHRAAGGAIHGDFAPWNLLRTDRGWVLIDWESAHADGPDFFDVFHYVVQSHALLGTPTFDGVLAGLRGDGPVGEILNAYAEGAGIGLERVPELFDLYLEDSKRFIKPRTKDGEAGLAARDRLLDRPH